MIKRSKNKIFMPNTIPKIHVIYALEQIEKHGCTLFLAGPTPRSKDVLSWRKEALDELMLFNRDRMQWTVLIPEPRTGIFTADYMEQVEWEAKALKAADIILFWVPRDIAGGMPGFTTNDEWGVWKKSGKVVWGNPPNADSVKYQRYYASKYKVPIVNTLYSGMVECKNYMINALIS